MWKVIKTERGDKENKEETKVPKKKKKRSYLERAVEGLTGIFIAFLSGSATNDVLRFILFLFGILLVLYAVVSD